MSSFIVPMSSLPGGDDGGDGGGGWHGVSVPMSRSSKTISAYPLANLQKAMENGHL